MTSLLASSAPGALATVTHTNQGTSMPVSLPIAVKLGQWDLEILRTIYGTQAEKKRHNNRNSITLGYLAYCLWLNDMDESEEDDDKFSVIYHDISRRIQQYMAKRWVRPEKKLNDYYYSLTEAGVELLLLNKNCKETHTF